MEHLRYTPTHSADENAGRIWGIRNEYLLIAVGGGIAGICVMMVCHMAHCPVIVSVLAGLVPLTLTLVYIFTFKHNRPPSFDLDCLELLIHGNHWGRHPGKGKHEQS
ncbi:MAG: hypothetical protein LBH01_03930 [Verrucomicrobiales bacterium]|jgi:hypothetical protein|nr:hypothetical protein [Verrucomicrobiales bacterium]